MMNLDHQAIFSQLKRGDLAAVARRARLPVADVEQQAHLICLEIASGASKYTEEIGSPVAYVMGQLWGWATREQLEPANHTSRRVVTAVDNNDTMGVDPLGMYDWHEALHVPSVIDTLIEHEVQQEHNRKARERGVRTVTATWEARLYSLGLTKESIADIAGVSRQSIGKRLQKA